MDSSHYNEYASDMCSQKISSDLVSAERSWIWQHCVIVAQPRIFYKIPHPTCTVQWPFNGVTSNSPLMWFLFLLDRVLYVSHTLARRPGHVSRQEILDWYHYSIIGGYQHFGGGSSHSCSFTLKIEAHSALYSKGAGGKIVRAWIWHVAPIKCLV